ncbi:MAG: GBS Bsp-like repeat-containing protein [Lachnospiraceae bacterium]|nr:GBS Bsp-like repeat-containing protein [Lachnospiraceae bacterium]
MRKALKIILVILLLALLSLPAIAGRIYMVRSRSLKDTSEIAENETEESAKDEQILSESLQTEEVESAVQDSSIISEEEETIADSEAVSSKSDEDSDNSQQPEFLSIVSEGEAGKRRILLQNEDADTKLVRFCVWSETNRQDDLVTYTAEKNADGFWEASFDASGHKHSGSYAVEAYVNGQFIEEAEFTVEYEELENEWTSLTAQLDAAKENEQLILVQAFGTEAELSMLNKESDGRWIEILHTSAYVGENGVGETDEWSHTTPPGIYSFGMAFGILPDPGTVFPYTVVDENDYWVDDVNSVYYNQFVSTDEVEMQWESAEHLIEHDPSYNYSLSINYNAECVSGAGSAIFLHCTRNMPTLGCVAVSEEAMRFILQNVRRDCKIIMDNGDLINNY